MLWLTRLLTYLNQDRYRCCCRPDIRYRTLRRYCEGERGLLSERVRANKLIVSSHLWGFRTIDDKMA